MKLAADYTCAGHWSLAAQLAGLDLAWHRSPFKLAMEVLRRNYPRTPLGHDDPNGSGRVQDASVLAGLGPGLVVGSPPCVGFTRANPNRANQGDDRQHVLRWVGQAARVPGVQALVMEMCPGWRDGWPEHTSYHAFLKRRGWRVHEATLDAFEHGGTQKRVRAVVFATAPGSRVDPRDLEPRPRQGPSPRDVLGGFQHRCLAGPGEQCPGDDSPLGSASGRGSVGWHWVPDDKTKGPFGRALKWRTRRVGAEPGKPAYVITQRATHMMFHPTQDRGLGVLELAALMGFPRHSQSPKPPVTYWLPPDRRALQLIGPGVDIRAMAWLLKEVTRQL